MPAIYRISPSLHIFLLYLLFFSFFSSSSFSLQLQFDIANEEKNENENNPLGLLQKAEMDVHNLEVKPRPSTKEMRLVFRIQNCLDPRNGIDVGVESEEDMKSWVTSITRAVEMQTKAYVERCRREAEKEMNRP